MIANISGMALQAPLVAERFSSFPAVFRPRGTKWPKTTRFMVLMHSGHARMPIATPAAYHLISEDENGEISDDGEGILGDSESSSNLKGERATAEGSRGINSTSLRNSDSPKEHSTRLTQSFGRLKHQRVRSLSRKVSWMKKEINPQDCREEVVSDMPVRASTASPPSDYKFRGRKNTETSSMREGSSPVATKSFEHRDVKQIRLPKLCEPESKINGPNVSAAKGWGNVESVQKIESRMAQHQNRRKLSSSERDFFSQKTFVELGCSEYMIDSLKGQNLLRPSHIQAMAFGPVMEGKSCIITDQSGSGKTLSYLVPMIQRLRQEELQGLSKSFSGRPRAVVLVPTAELASQVLNDCRSISKFGVPFRSMVATGGFQQRTQLENLEHGVDVLIVTPGRLIFLIKEGALHFTNLRCAVLDEVDILLKDEDFEPALQQLINSSVFSTQYLFVTATLPTDVYNKLIEVFPDCEVVSGPGVHRISPRLEEVLVDCSGNDPEKSPVTAFINKKSALLQLVEKSPVSKTIVFCNKIETCRKVENVLKRSDRKGRFMQVLPFHSALTPELRLANLKEFLNSQSQDSLFLVCTDRASRGIDFAGVDHVVLFDFPRDPSEYVRRVGRTARGARGEGKAFIYVIGKQVSLARRIMERNLKGHPLHDVPFVDHFSS